MSPQRQQRELATGSADETWLEGRLAAWVVVRLRYLRFSLASSEMTDCLSKPSHTTEDLPAADRENEYRRLASRGAWSGSSVESRYVVCQSRRASEVARSGRASQRSQRLERWSPQHRRSAPTLGSESSPLFSDVPVFRSTRTAAYLLQKKPKPARSSAVALPTPPSPPSRRM